MPVSNPAAVSLIEVEIPAGAIPGTVYTTSLSYQAGTTVLSLNGAELLEGGGNQYTETPPTTLTLANPTEAGDELSVQYKRVAT